MPVHQWLIDQHPLGLADRLPALIRAAFCEPVERNSLATQPQDVVPASSLTSFACSKCNQDAVYLHSPFIEGKQLPGNINHFAGNLVIVSLENTKETSEVVARHATTVQQGIAVANSK